MLFQGGHSGDFVDTDDSQDLLLKVGKVEILLTLMIARFLC